MEASTESTYCHEFDSGSLPVMFATNVYLVLHGGNEYFCDLVFIVRPWLLTTEENKSKSLINIKPFIV